MFAIIYRGSYVRTNYFPWMKLH